MRMISFNSPVCSTSSSAAASGRSSMLRISGRKISAPPTGRSSTKTPTTAGLPRAGETSSSPGICAFSRVRSAFFFPDAGCVRRLRCVGVSPGQDRHSAQRPGGAVAAIPRGVQAGTVEGEHGRCPPTLWTGYVSGGNALLRNSAGCAVLRRASPPH